jgi:polyisoprenoid-binding protein YceI
VGDLTIHGVTKSVTLHVKLVTPVDDAKQTRWSVTTEPLKRRDFNLMFGQAAESMSGISQTVQVKIDIVASRSQ